MLRNWLFSLFIAAALGASGCGDDGGSATPTPDAGVDAGSVEPTVAVATIAFPPPVSWTNEQRITVRGSTEGAEFARAIRVNGIDADSDDGFATWQAEIDLAFGDTVIKIESEDLFGDIDEQAAAATVTRSALALSSAGLALDIDNNRALMVDSSLDAVIAVALDSGERTILSGPGVGEGPAFEVLRDSVLDVANQRVLVIDDRLEALVSVDLSDGTRRVLAGDSGDPNGPLAGISGVALDSAEGRLLALDSAAPSLIAIDLDSGARALISGPGQGGGVDFELPSAVALDPTRGRALVLQGLQSSALIAVDLDSGERTVVSDAANGGDVIASFVATDFAVDAAGDRALAWAFIDGAAPALIAIDLESGERSLITSEPDDGSGRALESVVSLALDSAGGRVLALDTGADVLAEIALDSGERAVLSESRFGAGPALTFILDSASDIDNGRLVGLRSGAGVTGPSVLFTVALADGTRTVIADEVTGSGPALVDPRSLALSADGARALVADRGLGAIISVELATGVRELVSSADRGAGPELVFEGRGKVQLDAVNDRLLVGNGGDDAVIAVDLDSGDRALVSGATKGAGDGFAGVTDVLLDAAQDRILVLDSDKETLFAVDPSSGDREVISGPDRGAGERLALVDSLVLDAAGERAFANTVDAIIAIDLNSGDRRLLAALDDDRGPAIPTAGVSFDAATQVLFGASFDTVLVVVDAITGESVIISH